MRIKIKGKNKFKYPTSKIHNRIAILREEKIYKEIKLSTIKTAMKKKLRKNKGNQGSNLL